MTLRTLGIYKKIIYISLFICGLFLYVNPALAGGPTPTPTPEPCEGVRIKVEGSNDICFRTFQPFRGIGSHGIIPAIGELFQFVIILMALMWVINLLIILYNYLKNKGESGEVEKGWQAIQIMWQGLTLVLGGIIVFSGLSVLFGAGMPFDWADEYTQCGYEGDKVIYKKAREDFLESGIYPSGSTIEIACCEADTSDDGWYVIELNTRAVSVPPQYNPTSNYCLFNKVEDIP